MVAKNTNNQTDNFNGNGFGKEGWTLEHWNINKWNNVYIDISDDSIDLYSTHDFQYNVSSMTFNLRFCRSVSLNKGWWIQKKRSWSVGIMFHHQHIQPSHLSTFKILNITLQAMLMNLPNNNIFCEMFVNIHYEPWTINWNRLLTRQHYNL